VEPAQGLSVPRDGLAAGVDVPEPAPVSRLTGQAGWAGAWDEAARAAWLGSGAAGAMAAEAGAPESERALVFRLTEQAAWAAAAPEAWLPGQGSELASAGLRAAGLGVRRTQAEVCLPDGRGPAVEQGDWRPAAARQVRGADLGEELAPFASPDVRSASSSHLAAGR
jgi:hypothetical protein